MTTSFSRYYQWHTQVTFRYSLHRIIIVGLGVRFDDDTKWRYDINFQNKYRPVPGEGVGPVALLKFLDKYMWGK